MKFFPLYITNLWGVMNDNVLKILVCLVASRWVAPQYQDIIVNLTAGMLVLPYLLFSPLAGKLATEHGKRHVLRVAKAAEILIMLIAIWGFIHHSVWVCVFAVLLMGFQSALYSPAKYGLIKDIGGKDGVSVGMGGMEAVSFLGILSGSVLASFMVDHVLPSGWYTVLLVLAILGLICSLTIHARGTKEKIKVSASITGFFKDSMALMRKYRGLNTVVHYLSFFWWLSASLQIMMLLHCQTALGLDALHIGLLLALMAVGVSIGCIIGGKIDHKLNFIGLSPLLGLLMTILLIFTFIFNDNLPVFATLIFLISFTGGIFKIPLDAEIQKRVDITELSPALAYFNQVSFIYIFLASATNLLITKVLGLSSEYVFLFAAIVFGLASLFFIFSYRTAVCQVGLIFMKTHYDFDIKNREILNVPDDENLLMLPAHRAVLDPLLIFAILHDMRLQPLADEDYFHIPVIKRVLAMMDGVEVPDLRKSRHGVEKVLSLNNIIAERLQKNDNIIFYPSGHITLDGTESIGTRQLAYKTVLQLPDFTHVIGVRIDGLWGSKWSRYGIKKTPSLVLLLLKSALLIFTCAIFFVRRRKISVEFVDITDEVKEWRALSRVEFNKKLESFYSEIWPDGKEIPTLTFGK